MYNKGYQDTDEVVSACSTKVKGVTYTNLSEIEYRRVWDVADYVIPPQVRVCAKMLELVFDIYKMVEAFLGVLQSGHYFVIMPGCVVIL